MKFSSLDRLDKEKLLLKTALLLEGKKKKHEAGKQMGYIRDVVYSRKSQKFQPKDPHSEKGPCSRHTTRWLNEYAFVCFRLK